MINISDRQVVDTGAKETSTGDFRVPEVQVVGKPIVVSPESPEPISSGNSGSNSDIEVPRNLQVESQTVRIQPDGSAVIDVEVSFESSDTTIKHEQRITKI